MAASFQPQVEPARARFRLGFVVALLLAISAAVVTLLLRTARSDDPNWWAKTGQTHCTPLEVESFMRDVRIDDSDRATCFAIAGKIDRARAVLHLMHDGERAATLTEIFSIADPIADRGDDVSAAPIMELVVEFDPDNCMAEFHAGMAELGLGHDELARVRLEKFLALYPAHDGWRQRAEAALAQIAVHGPHF